MSSKNNLHLSLRGDEGREPGVGGGGGEGSEGGEQRAGTTGGRPVDGNRKKAELESQGAMKDGVISRTTTSQTISQ